MWKAEIRSIYLSNVTEAFVYHLLWEIDASSYNGTAPGSPQLFLLECNREKSVDESIIEHKGSERIVELCITQKFITKARLYIHLSH